MLADKTDDYKLLSNFADLAFDYINGDSTAAEKGEAIFNKLFSRLKNEFLPPIDREDLLELSQGLKEFFSLPCDKAQTDNFKLLKNAVAALPNLKNDKAYFRLITALRKSTKALPQGSLREYKYYKTVIGVLNVLERIYIKNC